MRHKADSERSVVSVVTIVGCIIFAIILLAGVLTAESKCAETALESGGSLVECNYTIFGIEHSRSYIVYKLIES